MFDAVMYIISGAVILACCFGILCVLALPLYLWVLWRDTGDIDGLPAGLAAPPMEEEDAAIARGIAADPDTLELTPALVAKMQPLKRRSGEPPDSSLRQ